MVLVNRTSGCRNAAMLPMLQILLELGATSSHLTLRQLAASARCENVNGHPSRIACDMRDNNMRVTSQSRPAAPWMDDACYQSQFLVCDHRAFWVWSLSPTTEYEDAEMPFTSFFDGSRNGSVCENVKKLRVRLRSMHIR